MGPGGWTSPHSMLGKALYTALKTQWVLDYTEKRWLRPQSHNSNSEAP